MRSSNRLLITRLIRQLTGIGSVLALAAGLTTALGSPATAADATTPLGAITGSADVAVGGGKVFVAADDRIVVANTAGALIGAITDVSGVTSLAVAPDGSRLYAALNGTHEIAEINTGDLTILRRIDLSTHPCLSFLSLSGTRLWVGYGCDWHQDSVLSLDVSAAAPQPEPAAIRTTFAPVVAAAGNTLVVVDRGVSPTILYVYDVSGASVTPRGTISGHDHDLGVLKDLTVTPDGSTIITAMTSPDQFDAWDATTLARVHAYGPEQDFTGWPASVALSADGTRLAGARESSYAASLALYDTTTEEKTHSYGNSAGILLPGSLAFSGTDLFGVLEDSMNRDRYLWRVHGAALEESALTLTAPSTGKAFAPITMTGRLSLPSGAAPGGQPLVITRRLPGGTSAALPGFATEPDGTFTITDAPPRTGTITYDVVWDGGPEIRWSGKTATVKVGRNDPEITLSAPRTGVVDQPLHINGVLDLAGQAPPLGTTLRVNREVLSPDGSVLTPLPAVTPASDGSFEFTDTPAAPGTYSYDVTFTGDSAFYPTEAMTRYIVVEAASG